MRIKQVLNEICFDPKTVCISGQDLSVAYDGRKLYELADSYGKLKNGNTVILYQNHGDYIELYSVRTPSKYRGQGSAHAAMHQFTDMLDSQGKVSRLIASPLDKKTRTDKLVAFYQKHGYALTGERGNSAGDPWMERRPNNSKDM
jgi:GNAT superfamily N-acetyltransferase